MSELSKFLGSPKEIEIDGTKITIQPLKVKDLAKFSKTDSSDEEKAKMSLDIMKLSLFDSTEEEINNLPVEVFTKIMEEINKLNGFTDESTDIIKKRIKQRKAKESSS